MLAGSPLAPNLLSVLREKPAGHTSGRFVLMYFLCGILYPVFKVEGDQVWVCISIPGKFIGSSYVDSGLGLGKGLKLG